MSFYTKKILWKEGIIEMNLKLVIEMFIVIVSVFLAIFISTVYTSFAASYIIGFITPILVNTVDNINIEKLKKHSDK